MTTATIARKRAAAPKPSATDEIGRKLTAYKDQGMTDAEIAAEMGVSRPVVTKYRQARGIPARRVGSTYASEWPTANAARLQQSAHTPPRQAEFTYKLHGQRFRLKASVPVVLAAMTAYARVALTEVP